ncbi:MAG: hypothetical protein HQ581_11325 [Planctomycetes bacterium]|nr:hypothetical protein [Planctomycetota bacterium]
MYGVPGIISGIIFCGDYVEANAWNEGEMKNARERVQLRQEMDAIERRSIAEMIGAGQGF